MTREGESRGLVPLRESIQSRHPGIAEEIEGAIRTLHKLRDLAGPDAPEPPPAEAGPDMFAATQALTAAPSGGRDAEAPPIAETEAEPHAGAELPLLAASTSFGRYQIARLLGRGAMGAVYLAYDTQLHRHVALKTPLLGKNPQAIQRFYREARAAAQLRSPYLCPVYDVGQIGTVYYLSMAFIDGQPMTRAIAEGRLRTAREIVAVTKKIAQGLHKAHERGIIHRDLKPDNIMIDNDGEPIVMDFGLARRVDEEAQVTMAGVIIGTPAYMSPEQAEGDPGKIGPSTDIYSLGVVFYQMLAGRLPFRGSLTSILRQIGSEPPPRPSAFNPEIGEDSPLERICLKMMAKSPADRYATMADVVASLERLSPGEDVPIVKASALSRIKSWSSGVFSSLARPRSVPPAAGKGSPDQSSADPAETIADPSSGAFSSLARPGNVPPAAGRSSPDRPLADPGKTIADP
jgi:serine/threonine protein kinase